jgi:hypothetical protein
VHDAGMPSEKNFGFVFAGIFSFLALRPMFFGKPMPIWAIIIALIFLFCALAAPRLLRPLNLIWFRFGRLLHSVMNPMIMGIIFLGVVSPLAILKRRFGKDLLGLKIGKEQKSYWHLRDPGGPMPNTMTKQF